MDHEPVTLSQVLARWVKTMRGDEPQTAFGNRVNVAQSTISAIENGGRDVRVNHVDAIARAYDMDALALLKALGPVAELVKTERALAKPSPKPAPASPPANAPAAWTGADADARAVRPGLRRPSAEPVTEGQPAPQRVPGEPAPRRK